MRIIVPQRCVNGGIDFKFDPDPDAIRSYDALKSLLSDEEYFHWMSRINAAIKPARSSKGDMAMLAFAPIPFVMPIWGLRRKSKAKKRKLFMGEIINQFNATYQPNLFMKWNRRPISQLTIEIIGGSNGEEITQNNSAAIVPYSITNLNYPDSHLLTNSDMINREQNESVNQSNDTLIDLLDTPLTTTSTTNDMSSLQVEVTNPNMINQAVASNPFDVYISNNK